MNRAAAAITFAQAALGTPYVWGGESKSGYDCSGLIYAAYRSAGIRNIGRTTYEQYRQGRAVGMNQLRPGDLVFTDYEGTGKPTHVVLYIGNGKVIAAPHTGDVVKIESLSGFQGHVIGARRLVHPALGQQVNPQRAASQFTRRTQQAAQRKGVSLMALNPVHIQPIQMGATGPQLAPLLGTPGGSPLAGLSAPPPAPDLGLSPPSVDTSSAARSLSALRHALLT